MKYRLITLIVGFSISLIARAASYAAEISPEQAKLSVFVQVLEQQESTSEVIDATIKELEKLTFSNNRVVRAEAELWLGRIYQQGLGNVEKDLDYSFDYFVDSAGEGGLNSEAQYELGHAYLYGIGTDKNIIAAYIWTTLSLQEQGKTYDLAIQQQQYLQNRLTDIQLSKANLLVAKLLKQYSGIK